jgi:hypothetical protein
MYEITFPFILVIFIYLFHIDIKMGKKQATESVNSKLALVMKSGKAVLGKFL